MEEKKKHKPLTHKQRVFVRGVAEGKPNYVAALEAYDTDQPQIASAIAVENLQKPSIIYEIEKARIKLNLTPERALKPIDDALNDDDVRIRLQGSDRALKIMGIGNKEPGNTNIFLGNSFKVDNYVKDN